jgi:hypothetical protein
MINGYDAWKLSNPWDDGHYTEDSEDTKPRIEGSIYFKFQHKYGKRFQYGMITTSGHDIKIWNYGSLRNIDVDDIETYVEDVESEIDRVKANYENFEYIEKDEFLKEFHEAHTKILNLVHREAFY